MVAVAELRYFIWKCPGCGTTNPGLVIAGEMVKQPVCIGCNALVEVIPPEKVGKEVS